MTRLLALCALLAGCAGTQAYELGEALQRHRDTVAGVCNGGKPDAGPKCQQVADLYAHAWEAWRRAQQCVEAVDEGTQALQLLDRVVAGEGAP